MCLYFYICLIYLRSEIDLMINQTQLFFCSNSHHQIFYTSKLHFTVNNQKKFIKRDKRKSNKSCSVTSCAWCTRAIEEEKEDREKEEESCTNGNKKRHHANTNNKVVARPRNITCSRNIYVIYNPIIWIRSLLFH